MKFELIPLKRNVSEDILLQDLKNVAQKLGVDKLSRGLYDANGKFSACTIVRRFDSWRNALGKVGLKVSEKQNDRIDDEEYFRNLESVWRNLGKQPAKGDIEKPLSKYSVTAYIKRFGRWRKALERFVKYVNEESDISSEGAIKNLKSEPATRNQTSRAINWRSRFLVMRRDNFKCKNCGRSPATDQNIILHVDHIKAWTNGGETILENLQTLCSICNVGKSNLE
ncbi:MAG TPA: HNH endonuclease [Candidatus Omnitrophota bacterium]|nr:HNH endonuclease [Candidatus Omnitrophota bacterium]